MNFTADLRSTQANSIGFYFASRICSVNEDFSVTFPCKGQLRFKETFTFFNTNQSLLILAQIHNRHTFVPLLLHISQNGNKLDF